MKDLLDEIIQAQKLDMSWNTSQLKNVIFEFLKGSKVNNVMWDEGSGEDWASFVCDGELLAILNVKIPICFAIENKGYSFLSPRYHTVIIEDFNKKEWYVTVDDLDVISVMYWHASPEAVNPDYFSVLDLRYATD